MSENNCAVYVHVNLINGKKYVGITTQNPPEKRWQNGYGYYDNAHFKNAILKYGWNNFAHYVLYRNIPIKIAKNIEEMLISEYMSYDPRLGYNKTMGGELEIPTEETRNKISDETRKAMKNPKVREAISKAQKEFLARHPEKHPMKCPEVAAKSAAARSKPVEATDPKTGLRVHYFESTAAAGRFGFDQGNVSACCRGERKTHAGLIWRYIEGGDNDDSDN